MMTAEETQMTADLLQFEHTGSILLSILSGTMALSGIVLAMASLVSPGGLRGKLKPVRLLSTVLCLVAGAAGCMYFFNGSGDAAAQNGQDRERTTEQVQQWARDTYGVTVDGDEAWRMVGEIAPPHFTGGGVYTVKDGERLLEVKLSESRDGTFHLVQTRAELPPAGKD